jgi:hypothetical protein
MERLTLSDSRGEYCATCFRVLLQLASSWYCRRVCGVWQVHVLVCDAVEGAVVIEAKVARVDDVVCPSICSELVERLQVSCLPLAGRSERKIAVSLTSHVSNAEHSYAALLNHAALVGEQRDSAGGRP